MMFIIIKGGLHHSLHDEAYQEYFISKVFFYFCYDIYLIVYLDILNW